MGYAWEGTPPAVRAVEAVTAVEAVRAVEAVTAVEAVAAVEAVTAVQAVTAVEAVTAVGVADGETDEMGGTRVEVPDLGRAVVGGGVQEVLAPPPVGVEEAAVVDRVLVAAVRPQVLLHADVPQLEGGSGGGP